MTTCVIGCNGNMGRRYMSILSYLKEPALGSDFLDDIPKASHYIIATPTPTHLDVLARLIDKHGTNGDISILIEKPVTKRPELLDVITKTKNQIYMVNQYAYARTYKKGMMPTKYDYFNSGKDGLGWDCIQLIHLARGSVELKNDSPVWDCKINGALQSAASVDRMYINMIKDFLSDGVYLNKLWGAEDIIAAHRKALAYEKSNDRSSGKVGLHAIKK